MSRTKTEIVAAIAKEISEADFERTFDSWILWIMGKYDVSFATAIAYYTEASTTVWTQKIVRGEL